MKIDIELIRDIIGGVFILLLLIFSLIVLLKYTLFK